MIFISIFLLLFLTGSLAIKNAILYFLIAFVVLTGISTIATRTKKSKNDLFSLSSNLLILSGALGALITYLLATKLHLTTTISSALVGLIAVIVFEKLDKEKYKLFPASFYCGSFVGMTAVTVIHNPLIILIAGAISGLIFTASQDYFVGVGGKLGTMAFVSVVITVFFLKFLKIT